MTKMNWDRVRREGRSGPPAEHREPRSVGHHRAVQRRADREPPAQLPAHLRPVEEPEPTARWLLPPDPSRDVLTQADLRDYRADRGRALSSPGMQPALDLLLGWAPTVRLPARLVTLLRRADGTASSDLRTSGWVEVDATTLRYLHLVAVGLPHRDLERRMRSVVKGALPKGQPPGCLPARSPS